MRPVVTAKQMKAIDNDAPESISELIERAGWATAKAALTMMGGGYGRRVAVLAGTGNNGKDGLSAARFLAHRGVLCEVFSLPLSDRDWGMLTAGLVGGVYDLFIDAAVGTGATRPFDEGIECRNTPVLAVDLPSGIDANTGQFLGNPAAADRTITFGALKPGLLLPPGRWSAGEVEIADIGLDCSRAGIGLLEPGDVATGWPYREPEAHKWRHAVAVIGGSTGMTGAVTLASEAAFRAGAGHVLQVLADESAGAAGGLGPVEAVAVPASRATLSELQDRPVKRNNDRSTVTRVAGAGDVSRCRSLVVGPGLAVSVGALDLVSALVADFRGPVVVDAGGLDPRVLERIQRSRPEYADPLILTPHEGEFERLTGSKLGPDRVRAVRRTAVTLECIVLLKGPTTVIAHPDGRVLLSMAGDERLATAGSGDVLAGIIGAGLAGGLVPWMAAGLGAELHGRAAIEGRKAGAMASDLPGLVADYLDGLR